MREPEWKGIEGKRFGRLTAIEYTGEKRHGQAVWRFECECGNTYIGVVYPVLYGHVLSCGCLNREQTALRNFKHGCSHRGKKEKLYEVWCAMKKRCENHNDPNYFRYGGRGIKVCDEWKEYFPFRAWAYKNGYREGLTVDRSDNNGNYEPGNCRLVTMYEQMNNTRRNVYLTYNGETKTISQWARSLGTKPGTICARLKRGWSVEEAVTVEPKEGRNQFWRRAQ